MYGCVRCVLRVARVDSGCTVFSFSKIKPHIRVLLYTYLFDRAFVIFSSFCFSTAAAAAAAAAVGAASFCTYSLQFCFFHFPFDEIYRRLLFFTLGRSVPAWIDYSTTIRRPSNTTTSGKSTDMIAGICTFPRLPCPSTTLHVMLNLTSATSTGVCHTGTSAPYVCSLLLSLTTNNTYDDDVVLYVGVLL